MSIALQADSTLPQGYILVNGTAATTIKQDGTLVVPTLSANNTTFTGNVGIGTSSPVSYANYKGQTIYGTNGGVQTLGRSDASRSEWGDTPTETYFKTIDARPLTLGTGNVERVRIDSSGNVGIGTSSPSSKLDVNGIVNAGGVQVGPFCATGLYGDSANIALRTPTSTGLVYFQNYNGATTYLTVGNGTINAWGNPITNCLTTAKAWVNFNGTTSGTWAGGTSTVTRVAGSTTATVTTTNPHGLVTGNTVYALTGVAAGSYTVTVLTSTTFTITTVATTALNANSITFQGSSIRSNYNVSSITKNGTGDYTVNFATAMADANYSVGGSVDSATTTGGSNSMKILNTTAPTVNAVRVTTGGGGVTAEPTYASVMIFGN